MRYLLMFQCCFIASLADAAWYQTTDGSIVNPILDTSGSVLPYSGPNLAPSEVLTGENLASADLLDADLEGANMASINLSSAKMWRSDLLAMLVLSSAPGSRSMVQRLESQCISWASR